MQLALVEYARCTTGWDRRARFCLLGPSRESLPNIVEKLTITQISRPAQFATDETRTTCTQLNLEYRDRWKKKMGKGGRVSWDEGIKVSQVEG